jgi:hypothetical protein
MPQQNSLDQAIEVSYQILQAIDNSDLDSVTAFEAKRQSLINDYFSSHNDIDEPQTRLLKKLNDDILKRLNDMQSQIRSQHSSLAQSTKASKAYLDNT